MHDTLIPAPGTAVATRVVLNLTEYYERTAALGADTAEKRREVAGLSRSTEWRWMHGVTEPRGRRAREFAQRLQSTTDKLFVEVAA